MALHSNGTVSAWGYNSHGQVSGANTVSGATAISAGYSHSLALHSNGTVSAWGDDSGGQVSGASSINSATAISAGEFHSLALLSNGTVSAWGEDSNGEVSGANAVTGATAVSAGARHSLALLSNGTIAAWGHDNFGQVSGSATQTNVVYSLTRENTSYAVRSDGSISAWGWSGYGQLNIPANFQLPTTVRWVSATNGDYLNSHLWNGRIPSTALSTAVFDNTGAYSIHFGNTARAKGLDVSAGDLTFDLGAHQYQVETNVNVASGASLTVNGTLTAGGELNNAGTYNNNGFTSVRTLDNSGTLNLAGNLSATHGLLNRGSIQVNYGSELLVGTATPEQDGYAHLSVMRSSVSILDGGTINSEGFANIGGGGAASPDGTVSVAGADSLWTNAFNIHVGVDGDGRLDILDGGRVVSGSIGSPTRIGDEATGSTGEVRVMGAGSEWEMASDLLIEGGGSRLTIADGAVVSNFNAQVDDAQVQVSDAGSAWINAGELIMDKEATLTIEAGGAVTNTHGRIAGTVLVTGNGSRWDNSGDLEVGRAGFLTGNLDVSDGGVVTSQNALVGIGSEAYGHVSVSGVGSEWINSENLTIGGSGAAYGAMSISDGGRVDTWNSSVVHGDVIVGGNDAMWLTSNNLSVGLGSRYSTVSIQDGGDVVVGNRTDIGTSGFVYISGGRFEFGKMSLDSYYRVGRWGGSMEGLVEVSGVHNMANLEPLFTNSQTDISQVRLSNFGILSGTAIVDVGLANQTTGQVRTTANDWLRFGGSGNANAGRITNLGGVIEFGGDMTNQAGGFITGRGAFIASNWVNEGSIAVSGTTDIIGNMNNMSGALIVTSANATTTFYDSVINNGEIRTSGNGNAVFFEDISGAGSFTGTGNVFFEGNVNPGNSPSEVNFGGNLTLGTGSNTLFELGWLNQGDYDRFNIAGSLNILGSMSVTLWQDFQLTPNMSFLIANIDGNRIGTFLGLSEGAIVGNFSGHNLFITYGAGNGNDIALFTAVPEPGAIILCLMPLVGRTFLRRRGKPVKRNA
jgi:T5SS/PEP-CTERM-associated repeat protein